MFRSTDGGTIFSQVLPASGLSAGAVPSIVVDPNKRRDLARWRDREFLSVPTAARIAAFSTGLTGAGTSADIELATQNIAGNTTLFAADSQENEAVNPQTGSLYGVFSTNNFTGGGNWTALASTSAGFNSGVGFAEKFQLVADPTNAGVVYLDGEGGSGIFRYNPAGAEVGCKSTRPEPKALLPMPTPAIWFLNNTTLLEADDGGFFFMQNPTTATTSNWQSFNGNLADHEVYSAAYDSTNNIVFSGTQDTGSPRQNTTGGLGSTDLGGGDGQFQRVDTTSLGGGNDFDDSLGDDWSFSFATNSTTPTSTSTRPFRRSPAKLMPARSSSPRPIMDC